MSKSKTIIESMDDEELAILLLCFSKEKVVEAMRIYHQIPGHLKYAFVEPGRVEMAKRGLTIPQLKKPERPNVFLPLQDVRDEAEATIVSPTTEEHWRCRLCKRDFTIHQNWKSRPRCPDCRTVKCVLVK